jgi:hypothetical protein
MILPAQKLVLGEGLSGAPCKGSTPPIPDRQVSHLFTVVGPTGLLRKDHWRTKRQANPGVIDSPDASNPHHTNIAE